MKGVKIEMCKQVKFRITDDSIGKTDEILGGIGIYDDEDTLINVICGCCGGIFEPEDIEILETYHSWVDLVDTIIGT